MNGYPAINKLFREQTVTVAASTTAAALSKEFSLTAGGATRALRIEIDCGTVTGTVDVILQQKLGESWSTVKTINPTTDVTNTIRMNNVVAADQAYMPLASICRVVATTGVGEDIIVTGLRVLQEQ